MIDYTQAPEEELEDEKEPVDVLEGEQEEEDLPPLEDDAEGEEQEEQEEQGDAEAVAPQIDEQVAVEVLLKSGRLKYEPPQAEEPVEEAKPVSTGFDIDALIKDYKPKYDPIDEPEKYAQEISEFTLRAVQTQMLELQRPVMAERLAQGILQEAKDNGITLSEEAKAAILRDANALDANALQAGLAQPLVWGGLALRYAKHHPVKNVQLKGASTPQAAGSRMDKPRGNTVEIPKELQQHYRQYLKRFEKDGVKDTPAERKEWLEAIKGA